MIEDNDEVETFFYGIIKFAIYVVIAAWTAGFIYGLISGQVNL